MNAPGLDLLLRVAGDRLAGQSCTRCGARLLSPRLSIKEQTPERIVLQVVCGRCDHLSLVQITPDSDEGIARVG